MDTFQEVAVLSKSAAMLLPTLWFLTTNESFQMRYCMNFLAATLVACCSSQYHVFVLVVLVVVPKLLSKFEFFGFLRVPRDTIGLLRVNSGWIGEFRVTLGILIDHCMYTYLHNQNYLHTLCHTDNHCHNSIELCKHADCEGNDWVTKSGCAMRKNIVEHSQGHSKAWCNSLGNEGVKQIQEKYLSPTGGKFCQFHVNLQPIKTSFKSYCF